MTALEYSVEAEYSTTGQVADLVRFALQAESVCVAASGGTTAHTANLPAKAGKPSRPGPTYQESIVSPLCRRERR